MPRSLSPLSGLDTLREEAQHWLKAISAGDIQALERLRKILPASTAIPKLGQVQTALAHEYGLPSGRL